MVETTLRLLRLLSILQAGRDWTGHALAQRLGVSERTVREDVARLRSLGYRIEAVRGPGGGYWLGSGRDLPPLLLSDEEAVALVVALRTAAPAAGRELATATDEALAKLLRLLPARLQSQAEALRTFLESAIGRADDVPPDILAQMAAACRDRQPVRFDYRRHDGSMTAREVEPHSIVGDRRHWYLLAWDPSRQDWRTFRMDRISALRARAGRRFRRRSLPGGDAARCVQFGVATATWDYRATVLVAAPAEELLPRLPEAVRLEPVSDSSCRLAVGSTSPQTLAAYLALLRADFVVEEPASHAPLLEALAEVSDRFRKAAAG